MTINDFINKPVRFSLKDPVDKERYKFAQKIQFTKFVKECLDAYQIGGLTLASSKAQQMITSKQVDDDEFGDLSMFDNEVDVSNFI